MKVVAAALCVGTACAFTGASLRNVVKSTSALQMADAAKLVGKGAPLGVFDPAGLAAKMTDAELLRQQESEVKHGRLAMLAVAGMAAAERIHPVFDTTGLTSATLPKALLDQTPFGGAFFALLFGAICAHELDNIKGSFKPQDADTPPYTELQPNRIPGDLGFDPLELGRKDKDPAAFDQMRLKELNNGRLAMIAVMGAIAQELVTGQNVF